MKGAKSLVSASLALGLLIYAAPRLEIGQGWTLPTLFAAAWLALVLLILAAHLHDLFGVSEEQRRQVARLRGYRRWQLEQRIRNRIRMSRTGE